ncbi:Cpsf4 [Phodopus roborovskii]|uniref:Cpsf4 protein n=1 Tax=Phodopus roborovskii TaxID=109678 RepID=A0AAV0A6R4_PHORO|nr:Cpsf4 [Phodopus roborovskii]
MQEIIASVDHIKFDLEIAVEQQLGAQPLPFPGMDKSGAAVCEFFLKAACGKGKQPLTPSHPSCGTLLYPLSD